MNNTIHESQIRIAAVEEIALSKKEFISTTELIAKLNHRFNPTGRDAMVIANRNDSYFSQKVRNIVSHRNAPSGLSANGFAEYDAILRGWRPTELGKKLTNIVG